MNRWKTTVDNHNKKLANMRESSLGASSNQGRRNSHSRGRQIFKAAGTEQITDKIAKLNNDIEVLSQRSSEKGHAFVGVTKAAHLENDSNNSDPNINQNE